jgi:transcriptional regulator with XRE-family HTH domain
VRKLRVKKRWTQAQLALKLQLLGWDTSRESITSLENQKRRVVDLELFILARVLGAKLESLFPKGIGGKLKAFYPQYRVKLSRGQIPRPN